MTRDGFRNRFPEAATPPSGSWAAPLLAAFGLWVALVSLYWPAVDFRLLTIDDGFYARHDQVVSGLSARSLLAAFTEIPETDQYIPLTRLSFMADVELYGGVTARGAHLTGILLFATGMASLLLVLWRATGSLSRSGLAAALAAFHPMRAESVAWVAERKDVLCLLFLALTVGAYVRYARTSRKRWYAATLLLFTAGILSKPILATGPALLLLLDFWPLGRLREAACAPEPGRRLLALAVEKIPFAAIAAVQALLTLGMQRNLGLHGEYSLLSRIGHSFVSPLVYLVQTFWPSDLAFRFLTPYWDRYAFAAIPAAAAIVAAAAATVRLAGRAPWLAFGWGWYLAALFPLGGIVPTGLQWLADRFTLIPHVGLAVAIAWGAAGVPSRRLRTALVAVLVASLLPLAALSRRQIGYWKDGSTLLGRSVEFNPEDMIYVDRYLEMLLLEGKPARALEELERHRGKFPVAPAGVMLQGHYLAAIEASGDREGAMAAAREFLAKGPPFLRTRLALADLLLAAGREGEAVREYGAVLNDPGLDRVDRPYALEGMGVALRALGEEGRAQAAFSEGIRLNPNRATLHYHLAVGLASRGRGAEARRHFEEGVRLDPANAGIRLALAEHLADSGDREAASASWRELARRTPGKAEAAYARGRLLEAQGSPARAREAYAEALRLPAVWAETAGFVRRRLGAGGAG